MPSSNENSTCPSTSCTSEDTEGHLDPLKGTCVFTPDMGGWNSVPDLVGEDSVTENVALSGNRQDLQCFNNNVKATCLSDFSEEVKVVERKRKASCDNPIDSESFQVPAGDKHFETCNGEVASSGKANSFGNGNPKPECASKFKELRSNEEDAVKIVSESCDYIFGVTTTIVLPKKSEKVKNETDIGSTAEKKVNKEQKNECNETIDRISDNLDQDNGEVSIEVEKTNGEKNIDSMCAENKTSEKTMLSSEHDQMFPEGKNTANNEVDVERTRRRIEITPEKQKKQLNITILDFKNGKVDGSADTVSAAPDIIQSPDGLEQQMDNEPKKNKSQETNEISKSADELQSNHELLAIEKSHGIDNTCQSNEMDSKSIPSLQEERRKSSLAECDANAYKRCEENLNKKCSGRSPTQIEFNMEQNTNYAKSPTKERIASHSSDNSPTKKSPVFQRGLFPRIAIRNPGIHMTNKLKKQLFIEKQKRQKALEMKKPRKQLAVDSKDPQIFSEVTKICETNDIKLKHAQVHLVKMNASMLSKYNVHLPSLHFNDDTRDRPLNSVSLSCDRKPSVSAKVHNLEHKIEFQVECAVPVEDEEKTSAKSSPNKKDEDQLLKSSIPACIVESTSSCSELSPVNISNSRTNCDTSCLESISDNLTGNDNTLLDGMEIKRRSKRRDSEHAITPTKKQKQSEMKIARVDVWKIDDLVLLKYGYDSKGSQIGKEAIVPFPSAHSSVSSVLGKSQEVETVFNSPFHSNPTVSAQPKTDVSIPKLLGKSKCSVGKSNDNLTPQVVIERIDKKSLSSHTLSKKACNPSSAKTNRKMKGSVKKAGLNGKNSRLIKRNEQVSLSGHISFNRSRSTTNSITKKKNSIKDKYNLKTAQVILKNINNSSLSNCMLSEYLPSKSKSIAQVSKTKLHIQSPEILQKRLLPKKQIISQPKYCGDIGNQNEMVTKANSSKGNVQDHSKENMCLNSNLKCLKGVRVNLYKLENVIQPKLII